MKVCLQCEAKFTSKGWQCPECHHQPPLLDGYLAFSAELNEQSNGYDDDIFKRLADIEEGNFWFRSRSRLIIWSLKKYFPDLENFFELGCGTGYVLLCLEKAFPKLSLYGGEVFVKGLKFASQRLSRAELVQMDIRRIPFEDEFEVMSAFDVLEHIKEDELALKQMHQAVRRNGGIVLTVPQHPFLWSHTDDYAHHVRRYTAKELKTKVENAGFEVQKMTSFVSLLFPLMIASRLRKQRSASDSNKMPELNVNKLLNALLEKSLDIERWMIRSGLTFPIGGSLLVVARKPGH
jgi:SAM-dependent methyltransferase